MLAIRIDEQLELPILMPGYAEEIFALVDANRARLCPWLPWVEYTQKPTDIRAFAEDSLRQFAAGTLLAVSIRYQGQWVGGSGLKVDRPNHRAEIGYWLAEPWEGKGIVTRTVDALTKFAFHDWKLHRVEIRCSPHNARSRAVPERLGFTYEGTLREAFRCGSSFQDVQVFAKLAHDPPAAT